MRIKKCLAALLIMVQVFSCATPITTYAKEYTEMEITVCCDGYVEKKTILEDAGGRKYVPLSWLTYYGSLMMKENKNTYEYYYVGEDKLSSFARRIFVNKNDNKFSIKLYQQELMLNPIEYYNWLKSLTKEQWETVLKSGAMNSAEAKDALGMGDGNWVELDSGSFSKKFNYNNELWVPMDQMLALCGVNVDVADGRLYIMHDTLSIWQVLYEYKMDDVLFDMDEEIWGHEGLSITGYVVDTGLNCKVLRLDFLTNSGRIMDYEELFEVYLSDNAAYLSMFEGGNSPISERQEMYRQYLEDVSTAWGLYGGIVKYADATKIIDILGKRGVDIGGLDLGAEADKVDLAGNIVSGLLWFYDYCNTYFNQVDDHREMLLTVYDYQIEKEPYLDKAKEMKKWPSYKAAQNVTEKYNTTNINTETVVKDGIWDLIKDEAPGTLAALFTSMKPWMITNTLMKPFLKDEFETIEDAAMLGYIENTLDIAYDTYTDCKYNGNRYTKEYDEESLNTMRLAGIMTLVISKYCYEYMNKQLHTEENDEKIAQIQEMLVAYYMAADGLEMDACGYYKAKAKSLKESLNYLTVSWVEDDEETEDSTTEDTTKPDKDSKPDNDANTEDNTSTENNTNTGTIDFTKLDVADLRTLTYSEAANAGMECTMFDVKTGIEYYFTYTKGNTQWRISYIYDDGELFSGEKYPSSCSVNDMSTNADGVGLGDAKVTVLDNIKTGMTYEEIAARTKVGRLRKYSTGRAWAGQDLGKYGMYDFWFTTKDDGSSVLTSVNYSTLRWHIYEDVDDYFSDEEYTLLDMDLLGLMELTYGEVTSLPADIDEYQYGAADTETGCDEVAVYIYMEDANMQYYFYYATKPGTTLSANALPYKVVMWDTHEDGKGWLSYDGGGNRKVRENIITGMYCSDILPYLSSYSYEECLETVLIENVGNNRTYTYYFENKGDDEWTWNDDEVVLIEAAYQDLNRLP